MMTITDNFWLKISGLLLPLLLPYLQFGVIYR